MLSIKDLKLAEKSILLQQEVVTELNTLVRDIERAEKTILDLQTELGAVNTRYPTPRTTRQDIGYLTDLLKCANKKLAWEKQIASMQKRTPGDTWKKWRNYGTIRKIRPRTKCACTCCKPCKACRRRWRGCRI